MAGVARPPRASELSLFDGRAARPGTCGPGPSLPEALVELDGLLVGCGGVAHGWADAIRRLPVSGLVGAVDRQALRTENMGPYVLAGLADLGRPKVEILADVIGSIFCVAFAPTAAWWAVPLLSSSWC